MNDVLPSATAQWRFLEKTLVDLLIAYGYQEIRTPLVENTALFKRSIGEVTDIVEKEMYTFTDRNGDSLTLRPEGTAGCVRACLEHGLLHNQQQKLWYSGPIFRHEKPQKGRYRQFTQWGIEAFGIAGVGIELELIALGQRLWNALGVGSQIKLHINTLGLPTERLQYRQLLQAYFQAHQHVLDDECQQRLVKNPLRILDSKNPALTELIANAPSLLDTLGVESRAHFDALCQGLETLGVAYEVNQQLVRGLDYYQHSVFEWVTDQLGSQAAVAAGGRYDGLVEQLGGRPSPAVGFAIGMERLLLLMAQTDRVHTHPCSPQVFVIVPQAELLPASMQWVEVLRTQEPSWRIIINTAGGTLKNQFKKADQSGAAVALIWGADDMGIKPLRIESPQIQVTFSAARDVIAQYLGE
jgi:histidyl-tRNA synthetase